MTTKRIITILAQPIDPDSPDNFDDFKAALVGLLRGYGYSDVITTEIVPDEEVDDGNQS